MANGNDPSALKKVQQQWDAQFSDSTPRRTRFWESEHILRHINKNICGTPINGFSQGLVLNARKIAGSAWPFKRGVSIGCGTALKEIVLLSKGAVERFDLFDLSPMSMSQGAKNAQEAGVRERTNFVRADAFSVVTKPNIYDFIHWDSSLHHMSDVEQAVKWSYDVCKPGGMFFMNEYVGPSRFQWTRNMLAVSNRIREALPARYLYDANNSLKMGLDQALRENNPKAFFNRGVFAPSIDMMLQADPSEAADSARILPSIQKYFPKAQITITGGAVYHMALNDILQNFDEIDDAWLLDLFLLMDDMMIAMGEAHFATAIAIKE